MFLFVILAVVFLLAFFYHLFFNFLVPLVSFGAVFAKSSPEIVEKIVRLSDAGAEERFVDIGSGDGRLVIAMAQKGIEAHGYEINPFLVIASKIRIKQAGVSDKAFVHWGDFWKKDFSQFNIVSVYGISFMMGKLEAKLQKELSPNSKVISNYFTFPGWKSVKQINQVRLYIKS